MGVYSESDCSESESTSPDFKIKNKRKMVVTQRQQKINTEFRLLKIYNDNCKLQFNPKIYKKLSKDYFYCGKYMSLFIKRVSNKKYLFTLKPGDFDNAEPIDDAPDIIDEYKFNEILLNVYMYSVECETHIYPVAK